MKVGAVLFEFIVETDTAEDCRLIICSDLTSDQSSDIQKSGFANFEKLERKTLAFNHFIASYCLR